MLNKETTETFEYNFGMSPELNRQFRKVVDNGSHLASFEEQDFHLNFLTEVIDNEQMSYAEKLYVIYLSIYRNEDIIVYEGGMWQR